LKRREHQRPGDVRRRFQTNSREVEATH